MQITVTIIEQGKATKIAGADNAAAYLVDRKTNKGESLAPPPPLNPNNPFLRAYKSLTEVTRHRSFCNLCNREGYLSSLFSAERTACPFCLGSKFTDREETLKTRLAGAVTYLRAARLLYVDTYVGFIIGLTTGLFYLILFNGFLALLGLL